MITVTNNSDKQINAALLSIDADIKQLKTDTDSTVSSLKSSIDEAKAGLTSGATYDINISGNAATANTAVYASTAGSTSTASTAGTADKVTNSLTITNNGTTYTYDGSSAVTLDYSIQNLISCSTASSTQIKEITALSSPSVGTIYNVIMTNANTYGSISGSTTTNVIPTGSGMQIRVTVESSTYLFDVLGGGEAVGEGCVVAGDIMELVILAMPTTSTNGTMIYRNCQVIYKGISSTTYYTKYKDGNIVEHGQTASMIGASSPYVINLPILMPYSTYDAHITPTVNNASASFTTFNVPGITYRSPTYFKAAFRAPPNYGGEANYLIWRASS